MLKKLMFGFAGLLLILAVGMNFLVSNIGSYVKTAIVKYGSEATKAEVGLDRVRLSLGTGKGAGALDNFTLGNPAGFSPSKAISIKFVSLQLDTNSIGGNGPIVIRTIEIDNPQIAYELNNDGSSNLQTIQRNTQDYANSFRDDVPAGPDAAKTGPGTSPRKVIINDLLIKNGHVSISQASLKGQQLTTTLPTIHLTDIGQAGGGATVAQVAEQILGSISSEAAQAAVTELAKQKINGAIKDVPGAAIGGAAIDNVGGQLKGLLGK